MTSTADEILSTTRRIPYKHLSLAILEDHMNVMARNSLDLTLGFSRENLEGLLLEGVLLLESASLDMHFLFVNIDSGKGFFGGQKASVATYVSRDGGKGYDTGPVLKNLLQALTGINNIYRDVGILNGIAS